MKIHGVYSCTLIEQLGWAALKDGEVTYTRENMGFEVR